MFAIALAAASAFVLGGCGDDDTSDTNKDAPSSEGTKAGAPPSTGGGGAAKLPADVCALLTLQEVQTVVTSPEKGKDVKQTNPSSVLCHWGSSGSDLTTVNVTVSTLPAGQLQQIRVAMQAEGKAPNGAEVAGLGDYAVFESAIEIVGEVKAIVKGLLLIVELNGPNGRAQKDKVITLAKAAAGRIQ
jgi:hypothetical protein